MDKQRDTFIVHFRKDFGTEYHELMTDVFKLTSRLGELYLDDWIKDIRTNSRTRTQILMLFLTKSPKEFELQYLADTTTERYNSRTLGSILNDCLYATTRLERFDLTMTQFCSVGFLIEKILMRLAIWTETEKTSLHKCFSTYKTMLTKITERRLKRNKQKSKQSKALLSDYVNQEIERTTCLINGLSSNPSTTTDPAPITILNRTSAETISTVSSVLRVDPASEPVV